LGQRRPATAGHPKAQLLIPRITCTFIADRMPSLPPCSRLALT
jgi:hypothetical protein